MTKIIMKIKKIITKIIMTKIIMTKIIMKIKKIMTKIIMTKIKKIIKKDLVNNYKYYNIIII
jgi:hypothetical protein